MSQLKTDLRELSLSENPNFEYSDKNDGLESNAQTAERQCSKKVGWFLARSIVSKRRSVCPSREELKY